MPCVLHPYCLCDMLALMKLQVGVKALIENNDGKYLFMRRAHAFESEAQAHWDIPGGRIEPEEGLTEGLAREINEEINLTLQGTPTLLAAQDIFVSSVDLHVVRLTYVAQAVGEPNLSDEHEEYAWMSIEEAIASNLDPYLAEVLSNPKTALK